MPAQVDVAMAPPPPTDVQSQMQQGPTDPGAMLAGLMPSQPPMPPPENMQRILQIQPVLSELALTVPQLAPEVSGLVERLKSRLPGGSMLGGQPQGGPGLPGAPVPSGPPTDMGAPAAVSTPGPPLPMAGMQPIQPQAMPVPTSSGVMGLAQQAEMVLPQIAQDDPTLAPDIQFFTARMRDEVAKVLQSQKGPLNPPPTEEMLNKLPVSM